MWWVGVAEVPVHGQARNAQFVDHRLLNMLDLGPGPTGIADTHRPAGHRPVRSLHRGEVGGGVVSVPRMIASSTP